MEMAGSYRQESGRSHSATFGWQDGIRMGFGTFENPGRNAGSGVREVCDE